MAKNKVIMNGNGVKIDISGFKTVTIRNKKTGELKQCIAIDIDDEDREKLNLKEAVDDEITQVHAFFKLTNNKTVTLNGKPSSDKEVEEILNNPTDEKIEQ
ncbi:MAG: hypothetical protein J6R31_00140 [Rikenellaceae bacterium]|nr:hypothetical protein [Rikenellaceae bacterium]